MIISLYTKTIVYTPAHFLSVLNISDMSRFNTQGMYRLNADTKLESIFIEVVSIN